MAAETTCHCGAKHTGHICMLKSQGLTQDIAHLTDHPTVACFTCGAEANAPDNVCAPVEIK